MATGSTSVSDWEEVPSSHHVDDWQDVPAGQSDPFANYHPMSPGDIALGAVKQFGNAVISPITGLKEIPGQVADWWKRGSPLTQASEALHQSLQKQPSGESQPPEMLQQNPLTDAQGNALLAAGTAAPKAVASGVKATPAIVKAAGKAVLETPKPLMVPGALVGETLGGHTGATVGGAVGAGVSAVPAAVRAGRVAWQEAKGAEAAAEYSRTHPPLSIPPLPRSVPPPLEPIPGPLPSGRVPGPAAPASARPAPAWQNIPTPTPEAAPPPPVQPAPTLPSGRVPGRAPVEAPAPSGPSGPSAASQPPNTITSGVGRSAYDNAPGKIVTSEEVAQFAKSNGIPVEEATKNFAAAGNKVLDRGGLFREIHDPRVNTMNHAEISAAFKKMFPGVKSMSEGTPSQLATFLRQVVLKNALGEFAKGGVVVPDKGPDPPQQIHSGIDVIRGSSNIPLSPEGVQQAHELGSRFAAKGGLERITSSNLDRALQTSQALSQATGAPVTPTDALHPWHLGGIEGQPTKEVLAQINRYVTKQPNAKVPGRGKESTHDGEAFNSFKRRMLGFLQKKLADLKANPNMKEALVTHFRDQKLVESWLKKGAPPSMEIDAKHMITDGDPPGNVMRLFWNGDKLASEKVQMENAAPLKPGIYLIRHGITRWNKESAGGTPLGGESAPPPPSKGGSKAGRLSHSGIWYGPKGSAPSAPQ